VREGPTRVSQRGANLVEFALLAPFLIMLLLGIVEFAWLFAQNLDVRHGAREGARLAATDEFSIPASPQVDICNRMDTANIADETLISVSRSGNSIGDDITVKVDAPGRSMTGLFGWAIPSSLRLTSAISVRQEQPPGWAQVMDAAC
jgi:hypothetical protein